MFVEKSHLTNNFCPQLQSLVNKNAYDGVYTFPNNLRLFFQKTFNQEKLVEHCD